MNRYFKLNTEPYKGYGDIVKVRNVYEKGYGYCAKASIVKHEVIDGVTMESFSVYFGSSKCNGIEELLEASSRKSAKKENLAEQKVSAFARNYAEKLIKEFEKYGVFGLEIKEELANE